MIKTIFISILLILQVFCINFSFWQDALDTVFSNNNSSSHQIITKDISKDSVSVKDYITNTTQTMLKFAIIIWVAVFLYSWIRFLLSIWDDSKAKKTRDTLIVSWVWLIIAFWAYVILQVILSIWYNTL